MDEKMIPIGVDIPIIGECLDEGLGIYINDIYVLTKEQEEFFFKLLRKANTKHHVEWGYKLWNFLLECSGFSCSTRVFYRAIPGKGVMIIQQGECSHNTEDRLRLEKRQNGNNQPKVGFMS